MPHILPLETVEQLRDAWKRGLSTRAAARAVGVHRNTSGFYYRKWTTSPDKIDPYAEVRRPRVPVPAPSSLPNDLVMDIMQHITEPGILKVIDAEIERIDVEIAELTALRRMAVHRHGDNG